jgi:hypothetical protein
VKNPRDRCTLDAVLAHPFIKKYEHTYAPLPVVPPPPANSAAAAPFSAAASASTIPPLRK